MATKIIVEQPVETKSSFAPAYDTVASDSDENDDGNFDYENVVDISDGDEFRLQNVLEKNTFVTLILVERKLIKNAYSWSLALQNQKRDCIAKVIFTDDGRCWVFSTDNEESCDFTVNLCLINLDAKTADIGECFNRSGEKFLNLKKSTSSLAVCNSHGDVELGTLRWISLNYYCLFTEFLNDTNEQNFSCQNSSIARITQSMILKRRRLPRPYASGNEIYNEFLAQINFKEFCNSKYRLIALIPVIASNVITCLKFYNPKYLSV